MVVAYIRVSTDKQDMHSQDYLIEQYAREHGLSIGDKFIVEVSSTKTRARRRIDELKAKLTRGDILIATEISRLGRSMQEVITLLLDLDQKGVQFCFIRQPELSNFNNATSKLLLAIYAYLAEAEREFISQRTKAGLAALKASGAILGRRKGQLLKNPQLDPHKEYIKLLRAKGLTYDAIHKLLDIPNKTTYGNFLKYCKRRGL